MLAKTKPNALYFLIISVCYLFQYYRSGLIYQFVNKNHAVSVKLSENHHQKYLLILLSLMGNSLADTLDLSQVFCPGYKNRQA